MPTERIQRRIDRLLDEAEQALDAADWARVDRLARHVLDLDAENADALTFLEVAQRGSAEGSEQLGETDGQPVPGGAEAAPATPASFASGRYAVKKFLGEGGGSAEARRLALGSWRGGYA